MTTSQPKCFFFWFCSESIVLCSTWAATPRFVGDGSEMTGSRTTPRPLLPTTNRQQVEVESAAVAEREKNLEHGAATAIFAMAILLGWFCLPKEAKHPGNIRLTVSLLLSFSTFLCGNALMLVNFGMLSLRNEDLISDGQRAASKCLRPACHVMMALTLLSLLTLLPGGIHLYVGLGLFTVIVSVAVGVRWCLKRYRGGGGDEVEDDEEQSKKLDEASKVTSSVTYSAFGGIVGVLFNASKVSAQAATGAVDAAAYAAIFFMFATAILGMLVTTVSKKVPEIRNPACRRMFVTGVRLANAFLLCTLACAALAASYTVLRLRVLAAFAPLAATAAVSFLLRHCVAARRRGREDREEARVKAMEDVASKAMVATLGGVMSVLGGWLGEKEHARWGAMDVFMVVLTSAFVSSFGFTVLAAAPGSARERLAPVARALIWSTVALFVGTAVAVYGMEVWTM
ncbi:unnamed protein product [Urochloa humidicola]